MWQSYNHRTKNYRSTTTFRGSFSSHDSLLSDEEEATPKSSKSASSNLERVSLSLLMPPSKPHDQDVTTAHPSPSNLVSTKPTLPEILSSEDLFYYVEIRTHGEGLFKQWVSLHTKGPYNSSNGFQINIAWVGGHMDSCCYHPILVS